MIDNYSNDSEAEKHDDADKLGEWSIPVLNTNQIIQGLKAMYQAVYDVDTAMTKLYKNTDETNSKYEEFLNNAGTNAQNLGRTMTSYIEQTGAWAKLGYSLDQSAELAKISSIYANNVDVEDDIAVSNVAAAMKAFNIEAKDAITIIEPLTKLENEFTTSANALGEGLQASASAMAAASSAISVYDKQDLRMDSLEGKSQQLKAAFQSLSNTILNPGILKFLTDLGTTGLSTLDAIMSKINSIGPQKSLGSLFTIAGGILGMKNVGRTKMFVLI